ncbi:GNAT family N-acetyltransferase [Psychroserpens sp. XS_ASV72]|uniref:GNAT family N-acetyltransferase n=1 Tax=Psychroserpens sp. XS_ASV72 TaxID=3241293 RepID=UPI0035149754
MIYKEDKLFMVLPAHLKENVLYSHQGLTYGGFVLGNSVKLKSVLEGFKCVLKYLEERKVDSLFLKPIPNIYCKSPSDELEYLLFLTEANCYRKDTLSVIDFNNRIKVSNDRKNGYKRGVKNNLKVKEVDTFEEFWNDILTKNLQSKHQVQPVHSVEEITYLKEKFPKHIRQFNVYDGDEIVAGTTIFETSQLAHSQYISGNDDKNALGSLDFLHMYLLDDVFKDKQYFDFGISNEDEGTKINEGLQYWKEGFGARTIVQNFYEVPTKNHNLLNDVFL